LRIAELLSTGITNGAARHCLRLCEALAQRGHQVLLIHRPGLDIGPTEAAGVTCIESSFRRSPGEIMRVGKLMKAHGTEVAHSHMSSAHAMGAILRLFGGPPIAATAHSRHLQIHWFVNDLVIALNEVAAAYHRRVNLVSRKRMVVIPTFLGAQWIAPATPQERAAARRRLGIAPDALAIGQVGDVNMEKRQSDFILAARALIERRPEVTAVLKGAHINGDELKRLDQASQGIEDRILRIGRPGEVRDVLHALDVFVLSSRREEGPFVAVEAMAAGLPVVSTRVGRMEALLEGGEAGFLVEPGDVPGMKAGIERLAEDADLRRRMGEAARKRALVEQDVEPAVAKMEAALARIARRPASASRRSSAIPA
jgi:glycosyltransferase involved in cell wall biosynthesis